MCYFGVNFFSVLSGINEYIFSCIKHSIFFVKGIPPRGQFDNPLRKKINHINSGVSASVSGIPNVSFFDFDPNLFINSSDGSISHLDMYDYLHLTRQGYRKLLEPLLDEIQTLLKNFLSADAMSASEAEI